VYATVTAQLSPWRNAYVQKRFNMSKSNQSSLSGGAKSRLFSIAGASRELGICCTLVYALVKGKRLRSITIGRRRLIPAEAIEAFTAGLNKKGDR
jgi:excisionase family DNA binding protein